LVLIIAGAGVSGAYFARLLSNEGVDFTLYDVIGRRGHRCAWGTPYSLMKEKLDKVGLDVDDYVLCRIKQYYINGVKIELKNVVVIDKPKLLEDLSRGIKITYRSIDLSRPQKKMVVNATGKPLGKHYKIVTTQRKIKTAKLEEKTAYIHINFRKNGYAWAFPLNDEGNLFHLGAGCYGGSPALLESGLYDRYNLKTKGTDCTCQREISIFKSMIPVVVENVASIGEAAGCVSPLSGEGILSAMETAEWLAHSLKHDTYPQSYLMKVEEMQESYNKSWKTWNLMNKHPHLGWVFSFVNGMKRSKIRSAPSVTKRAIASIVWNWLVSLI
jgi:flavin-dependent dehydrogenase